MDLLFGGMPDVARFVLAFVLVLGLIGAGALLWRRFGAGPLATIGPRGRQPRLAVIDVASVDIRRRLVLIRRDNTEHLLLIGGPTDIVIEPNIARTGAIAVTREPRPIPTADVARSPASADGPPWPLEPAARTMRPIEDLDAPLPEPAPRTAREAMVDSMRAVRSEPAARRSPPIPPARPSPDADSPALTPSPTLPETNYSTPLAPAAPEPRRAPSPPPPYEPVFQTPPPEPQWPPAAPEPASRSADTAEPKRMAPPPHRQSQPDENNLAEMAQRLEAALRRPTKPVEPPPLPPMAIRAAVRPEPSAARKAAYFEGLTAPKANVRSPDPFPSPPPELKVLPGKKAEPPDAFESLEDEMAKMLGRSPGSS
jgi:flagellar protein FliO/FliZ